MGGDFETKYGEAIDSIVAGAKRIREGFCRDELLEAESKDRLDAVSLHTAAQLWKDVHLVGEVKPSLEVAMQVVADHMAAQMAATGDRK